MSAASALQFESYTDRQPLPHPAPVHQPQDWFLQPLAMKKPSQSVSDFAGESWESAKARVPVDHSMKEINEAFVLEDRHAVIRFIEEHRLQSFLLQARRPLDDAFTVDTVKMLSLSSDDEGFETLFCLVMVAGDMQKAREALRQFDRQWWLAESKNATGKLNFDFELI